MEADFIFTWKEERIQIPLSHIYKDYLDHGKYRGDWDTDAEQHVEGDEKLVQLHI